MVDCVNHPGTPAEVLAPRMRQHPDAAPDTFFEVGYQPLCAIDYVAGSFDEVNANILPGWQPQAMWLVGSTPIMEERARSDDGVLE